MRMNLKISKHDPFISLYRQSEDYFFRSLSSHCLDSEGVTAYATGANIGSLNPAYVKHDVILTKETLCKIYSFYKRLDLPFELIIPETPCLSEIKDILKNHDYVKTNTSVCMGTPCDKAINESLDKDLTIKSTNANLTDWAAPLTEAFESPMEIIKTYGLCHKKALNKGCALYHFSLFHNNRPTSSLTLSVNGETARIDDVGTLPEFQRKGYASSLITHALAEARNLKAIHCFLEASQSSQSLYQKIGFKKLFNNCIYSL